MVQMGSLQANILSGGEGQFLYERRVYLTLLGNCTLAGPTFAQRILATRKASDGQTLEQPHFVTILGAVSIKCPTVAEEYIHARELLSNGSLTLAEWDRVAGNMEATDIAPSGVTLLGGFNANELPTENEEVDALAMHRHVGNISPEAFEVLKLGIGQRFAQRRATIRRAL